MSGENQVPEVVQESVSLIIVTFNSQNEIQECLNSIEKERNHISFEVVILDNASTDETQKTIQVYSQKFSNLKFIINNENQGLAKANNQAAHMCNGKYIMILNPDTILKEGAIKMMAKYLDLHDDVGIVGCKNLFENGDSHRSFHHNWTIFHILLWRIFPNIIVRFIYDKFSNYKEETVLFVSGACLMIRRDLFFSMDGYDERFFLSAEDTADLCLRANQNGYRTVFYPEAEVIHLGGRSHKSTPGVVLYYGFQGSIYFLQKHKGYYQAQILRCIFILNATLRAIYTWILSLFFKQYKGASNKYFEVAKLMIKYKL